MKIILPLLPGDTFQEKILYTDRNLEKKIKKWLIAKWMGFFFFLMKILENSKKKKNRKTHLFFLVIDHDAAAA